MMTKKHSINGLFGAAALTLLLSGCVAPHHASTAPATPAPVCAHGDAMAETTLYFGLSRPAGPNITDAEWQHFLDQEVTPRFKDGLTVFNAQGQWLGSNGKVAKEGSRALMLIHADDKDSNAKIETLRTLYKTQFGQESVMRVDTPECVSF
jgi:hypothetical protein